MDLSDKQIQILERLIKHHSYSLFFVSYFHGDPWRTVFKVFIFFFFFQNCSVFMECPNPDEAQRAHLGRELRVEPQQIKFWFKNRRAQMRRV